MGLQEVALWQTGPIDGLQPQQQRVIDSPDLVGHGQRHARRHDAVVHHLVAQQLESTALQQPVLGRFGECHRLDAGNLHSAAHPIVLVLLELLPGVTPDLHFTLCADLRTLRVQKLPHRQTQARQAGTPTLHELLAHQLCQPGLGAGCGSGGWGRSLHGRILERVCGLPGAAQVAGSDGMLRGVWAHLGHLPLVRCCTVSGGLAACSTQARWRCCRRKALKGCAVRGSGHTACASYTVAPAFGSFGSCTSPSLRTVFTRSSRLTPSHMAIDAATNTDE